MIHVDWCVNGHRHQLWIDPKRIESMILMDEYKYVLIRTMSGDSFLIQPRRMTTIDFLTKVEEAKKC